MKKTISLVKLLAIASAAVLLSSSVTAKTKPCREQDRVTRTRDGRETVTTPVADPCQDQDPTTPPPPAPPQKDFNVVLQEVTQPTHVLPDTDGVTIARVHLDATNSDEDVQITSLKFGITIISYADYSNLQNCTLYHNGSLLQASGIAQATTALGNNGVTTSQSEIAYAILGGNLVTPHNGDGYLDLICDLPPALTLARITTEILNDDFTALDLDGHEVDYVINSHPGHTIEVYSGNTPPPGNTNTPDGNTTPGTDGEDGSNSTDPDDSGSDGNSTEDSHQHPDRDERPDRAERG